MTLGSGKKKCGFQCQGTGITSLTMYLHYNVYHYTLAGCHLILYGVNQVADAGVSKIP
ncbi:hypothetical protein [Wolbachia endosymbiont (group A) of Agelastica alni]|uniref:hypothetical protein n=1 Tax=Wolbachia endosymbiont (group A) of Agelastica alni TaxID=3066130 RepID=UPI00313348B1